MSLAGITIENVDKMLKRMKPGKVPFKLMRSTNAFAVIHELDKLSNFNKSLQSATFPLMNRKHIKV